ncbi:MAG TPA: hypothetical protein PLU10_02605 [Chitinophagaceae bacterium]|nr:hypothetical protein [Chitinophagaceae bacterium]
MKRCLFCMGLVMLTALNSIAQTTEIDYTKPPKSNYEAEINGKVYAIKEGEELVINEVLDHPKVKVREASTREFNNGIVRFKFSNFYAFEFEEQTGFKNWTLNGKSTVFMFFQMAAKVDRDVFAGQFIDKFGRKNCKSIPLEMKMGDKTLMGTKINVGLIGQKLGVYFVEVPVKDGGSAFIYIQDVVGEEPITKECQQFIELMDSSIHYQ